MLVQDANFSEGWMNAHGRGAAAAEVMELFKASRLMAVFLLHSSPPRTLKQDTTACQSHLTDPASFYT